MPELHHISAFSRALAVVLGAGLLLLAKPALGAPDWKLQELRSQLARLSDDLRHEGPMRTWTVPDLIEDIELPEIEGLQPQPSTEIGEYKQFTLRWTDKRLALAALSQPYGNQDNRRIMEAGRPGDTEALEVVEGVLTLSDLKRRLAARHLGYDIKTGADILRVPLIIGKDATLRLTQGDALLLSREDGAFVVNFGKLEIISGEIAATSRIEEETREFAPFVATVGSGTVRLSNATLRDLGFGFTAKYAGFSILAHTTMQPGERNFIDNSRFDGLVAVALVGVKHAEVRGNRFFDMRRNPLLVSQSPSAVVEGNLFSGNTPTNAVRVANGSSNARLVRNIVLEGSRAGLLISSGSDNVLVTGNLIWRRNGGGIKLHHVRCGRVQRNVILDDKQKGVEIRTSPDSLVAANRIIGNANAGVWVSAQKPENITYVLNNLLRENGSGLSTASGGDIALAGNDLTNQFPRFLDGDVTFQFRAIIADLNGEIPIVLDSGGSRPASQLVPDTCDY